MLASTHFSVTSLQEAQQSDSTSQVTSKSVGFAKSLQKATPSIACISPSSPFFRQPQLQHLLAPYTENSIIAFFFTFDKATEETSSFLNLPQFWWHYASQKYMKVYDVSSSYPILTYSGQRSCKCDRLKIRLNKLPKQRSNCSSFII